MPPKSYMIRVMRGDRAVAEVGQMDLDLGDAASSRYQLTKVLADAIKATIGAGRLKEVWRYRLEVRERGRNDLALPPFTATFDQVKGA